METDNLFLNNLNTVKESILDEEKLVTYVSLSKDLCIHVNDCKLLLYRAIDSIREEQPNLQLKISYVVSGISDVNNARIIVCPEEELYHVRDTFKTILFEHVYSVSKGVGNDNNSVLLLHKFEDFVLSKGLIKNSECNKHRPDKLNTLKEKKLAFNAIKEAEPVVAAVPKLKKENNVSIAEKTESKLKKEYNSSSLQLNTETPKTTELDSLPKQINETQNGRKIPNVKNQKGIAGFFTKSILNSKKSSDVIKNDTQIKKDSVKVEKTDFEDMDIDVKAIDDISNGIKVEKDEKLEKGAELEKEAEAHTEIETNKKIKTIQKPEKHKIAIEKSSTELNKSSKSSKIKKIAKVEKNRKRVLQVSDSDSEEENDPFANKQNTIEDSEDEIPPTPMANHVKITSGLINPKKKRKIVDKTYMSEDGYVITKKEEVYESCSDNEQKEDMKVAEKKHIEEKSTTKDSSIKSVTEIKKENGSPVKKSTKKQTKKQLSPPKGKQATMTSFFKRK